MEVISKNVCRVVDTVEITATNAAVDRRRFQCVNYSKTTLLFAITQLARAVLSFKTCG